jgi:hypothetical protein
MCLFSNSTRVSSPEALYWVCVANDFSCSMKQIDSRVWSREVEMQSCQFCHSKWGKSISNMQSAMGYLQSHSSPKDHRHTTRQARPQPQESDTPHTAEDPQASATQEVMSSKSKAAGSNTSQIAIMFLYNGLTEYTLFSRMSWTNRRHLGRAPRRGRAQP